MNTSLTNITLSEVDPVLPSIASCFIIFVEIINFCLGIPLNVWVTVLLIRVGGLDESVIFSLSLMVTELLFILLIPLNILCHVDMMNLCFEKPIAFFIFLCLSSRLIFQGCVCFERYLAVVHPILFLKYKVTKYRVTMSIIVWVISFFVGILNMIFFQHLPFTAFGVMLILILSMNLFFCFSILRILRRPRPGEREKMDVGANAVKTKALEVVSFNLLAFLIQIIPVAVTFGMRDMLTSDVFLLAFSISADILVATGILQPITCLHQIGKLEFPSCV